MIRKSATAEWSGGLKDGIGNITTQTGVLDHAPYGFKARFEDGPGTNPEELIGAAHAGCFTMALSGKLAEAGMTAQKLTTTATVMMEKTGDSFTITAVHLDLTARIPGADRQAFEDAARKAKEGCPVSKLLNATISLDAKLEG